MNDSDDDPGYESRWRRRCDLLYQVKVTYRYHRRRQRFWDITDKGTKALTVLLGASLLGETLKHHLPLVASLISGLGLLALVFGYSDRKQSHKECAETAMQLVGRIEEIPMSRLDEVQLSQLVAEHARQNAKEPPALKTLVVICEYEESVSLGHPDQVPLPCLSRRIFADFIS
ncbi:MAG: hypothetical protein Q7K57_23330 [Burkholderiaceae bacterium]|nr:hypothetical protein [Burkholderiaceae bacterium]